ncbi:hypothetical protein AB0B28_02050 [Glycomyces sp. NPDC046736]|uniref:hypothetical protein n=1 Tax=Glycomyces sp. NPDC046736 TaxID=3155615 RepID=UPI0033F5E5AE
MVGGWVVLVFVGAGVAPGFAASGSTQNEDPRDEAATDAKGAALRYLRYGSNEDLDRASAALCDGASPELTPADLDAIRQGYAEQLGGITDVDPQLGEPVPADGSIVFTGTVDYVAESAQRTAEFIVTVQEDDGTYCVSDAVQVKEDPGPDTDGTSPEVEDPEVLANRYLTHIVGNRDTATASAMQCPAYSGITLEDLTAALDEWETKNGWRTGSSLGAESTTTEGPVTVLTIEVELEGDIAVDRYTFEVGVQGNCVASLEGAEGLFG